ncbi:uncharacterized protein LOC134534853 isoform X2 [Bacillus rossius redtenbacheri]|uniref:uncharacterized protein LOC134534853 isoform X2 n=1 Tax=Bacillus rossius redtenbacheri TaxID=93214 RepID=UPI002FDD0995
MGKKGNKRKTRWRVLPIGGDDGGACSCCEEDVDMEGDAASPGGSYARAANGGGANHNHNNHHHNHRLPRGFKGRPPGHRGGYHDGQPLVTTEKKTFNEEEYTKITTPRQDVLFKKGYLGRKRPTPAPEPAATAATAAAPADVTNGNLRPDGSVVQNGEPLDNDQGYEVIAPDEQPQIIYTNGYVDHSGIYYINGGYELYDPYSGGVTVVVGPAPPFPGPGGGAPVLAAVPCRPLPLQPLEWFNPAFVPFVPAPAPPPPHDPGKRFSVDSQNCSPQSSESTGPPGSPQECEDGWEPPQYLPPPFQPQGHSAPAPDPVQHHHHHQHHQPHYVYPGYMFGPPVYNVNGVTVQGAPPPPPPGDPAAAAASKRRKKKRRRRRRRGGAEDGSEESSSEEKELEEPMSITSQESSSQELESDSKQSPTAEQDAAAPAPQGTGEQGDAVIVVCAGDTLAEPAASERGPAKTGGEGQEQRIVPGEVPLVNGASHSDSSDTPCTRRVSEEISTTPPTPPPSPIPATTAQESPPGVHVNGYGSDALTESVATKTKAVEKNIAEPPSPSPTKETVNNAANKIKSGKISHDPKKKQETKKPNSNSKNQCNGNVNVKLSGGKVRKENKQRNLQNGYLPNLTLKMDGNENAGLCRDQVEKTSQMKVSESLGTKPNCLQHESVTTEFHNKTLKIDKGTEESCTESKESVPPNCQVIGQKITTDKSEKNYPPNKPIRKDLCKPTKSSSASVTLPLRPELPESIQTVPEPKCMEADESKSSSILENAYKTLREDDCKESLEVSACPAKQLKTAHMNENVKFETHFKLEESNGVTDVQEEKCTPSAYRSHLAGVVNASSTEDEREAEPPPVPPPRRKRWRTSARRQSSERAPTPGRELDVCADIPEGVSDESSLSSSTQSEESVIELLSSMPTSPDVEAKTRSSEDDDLIYARRPVGKLEILEMLGTEESFKTEMTSVEMAKFADVLSRTIVSEAVEDAVLECSKNTRPITHAVTRWLRSQSPEEVLSLPSREHSESELDDTDVSGGSMEDIADVRQKVKTGPKNVHRNPLPAPSPKISFKLKNVNSMDGTGRRVAKKSGYKVKLDKKTAKDTNNKVNLKVLEGCDQSHYDEKMEQNKLPKNNACRENVSKVQMDVVEGSFSSDLSECEGEWDLWECGSTKPSPLTAPNNINELSFPNESPEDRRTTMCDPALSVAKYYSLGVAVKSAVRPEESSDTASEYDSEVDALHHFRNEMEEPESRHPSLASELARSYEPLPKHWAVDPVTVTNGKLNSSFQKRYLPDSGVQSEDSGDEVTIGSNAQRMNFKANLLHHQSAILMSRLQGDGPFPCGGICCILQ